MSNWLNGGTLKIETSILSNLWMSFFVKDVKYVLFHSTRRTGFPARIISSKVMTKHYIIILGGRNGNKTRLNNNFCYAAQRSSLSQPTSSTKMKTCRRFRRPKFTNRKRRECSPRKTGKAPSGSWRRSSTGTTTPTKNQRRGNLSFLWLGVYDINSFFFITDAEA